MRRVAGEGEGAAGEMDSGTNGDAADMRSAVRSTMAGGCARPRGCEMMPATLPYEVVPELPLHFCHSKFFPLLLVLATPSRMRCKK
jgi:hypothetical protein